MLWDNEVFYEEEIFYDLYEEDDAENDEEDDEENADDGEDGEAEQQNIKQRIEQMKKMAETFKKIIDALRAAAGDVTALLKLLKDPKTWKLLLGILAGSMILLLVFTGAMLLYFSMVLNFFKGLGTSIIAGWTYFWSGTDSYVTDKMVEEVRRQINKDRKVGDTSATGKVEDIAYVGERIFNEVGLTNITEDGKYTITVDKYKGKVDAEGNLINRYYFDESDGNGKYKPTTTEGTIVDNELDIDSALGLYIKQYLCAQEYSMNKYNGWTVSDNTGAIKIRNDADGFWQAATGTDENGLYVNVKKADTGTTEKKIYLNDYINEFGMPWQFPYAFHEATLSPDLGWDIAQLAKDFHSMTLDVIPLESNGYYINEDGTVGESFTEIKNEIRIYKLSTWFSSETNVYEKKIENNVKDGNKYYYKRESIIDHPEQKEYSEANKEVIKALLSRDAEYYRANCLNKKDKLVFESSADIVLDSIAKAYLGTAETEEEAEIIDKEAMMECEPVRNLMIVFEELGYVEGPSYENTYEIDSVSYISPIDGYNLFSNNWPNEAEKVDSEGYVSFITSAGQNVISIADAQVVEVDKENNTLILYDTDNRYTIVYSNININNGIEVGDTIGKSSNIGRTINEALKIRLLDENQTQIDPTASFIPQGELADGYYIYYNQADSPWGSRMYSSVGNSTQTYQSSACGPSSLAIIIANIKDTSVTPLDVGEKILTDYPGYRTANNGTSHAIFTDPSFLGKFGMKPGNTLGTNPADAVKAAYNGCFVAIIQTHINSKGGESGHYLVFAPPINNEEGWIYVLDPGKRQVNGNRTYANFVAVRRLKYFRGAWAFNPADY